MYAASFANPAKRILLLVNENNALYAPDGEGRDYLLWVRGGILLAQELDTGSLKLKGEPHVIADPVVSIATRGTSVVSVSAAGDILYSASGGTSQIEWLDGTGRQLGTVGEPGVYTYPFRLSPDGRRVVATRDRPGGMDLWVLDVERPIANRLTSAMDTYTLWSPDSHTIVFSRDSRHAFRKDVEGIGKEQTVQESVQRYPNDWSLDGRFILSRWPEISGSRRFRATFTGADTHRQLASTPQKCAVAPRSIEPFASSFATHKIRGIYWIAASLIFRTLRIRAQRSAHGF